MAITKIHAITKSVQKAVDYICNPDKTDGSLLVDSFACCPQIAGIEFEEALSHGTGRGNKQAFHLIQSFAPDEVDADTAHLIGRELATKHLKGNYSYVIATHVDKHSIHNHIIFCAVDNFEHKKYYDSKKTYRQIRDISDELCRNFSLSVIPDQEHQKGMSYDEWYAKKNNMSWKEDLRNDIRKCIRWSNAYDDFAPLMQGLGYEVKDWELPDESGYCASKYVSFRAEGYKHFVRGCERTLGKGFTKEEIARAIDEQYAARRKEALRSVQTADKPLPVRKVAVFCKPLLASAMPVRSIEDLVKKTQPFDRLIDTSQEKYQQNPGLMRWAEIKNLQSAAHAFAQAGDTVQLQEKIDAARKELSDINGSIVESEKKIAVLKELAFNVKKYQQYKKYGEGYSKSRDRERFYENHESQMIILDAAIRFIRSKGINPDKITYEQVAEGIEKLNARVSDRKQRYRQLSDELKDMEKQMSLIQGYIGQSGIPKHRYVNKHRDDMGR